MLDPKKCIHDGEVFVTEGELFCRECGTRLVLVSAYQVVNSFS